MTSKVQLPLWRWSFTSLETLGVHREHYERVILPQGAFLHQLPCLGEACWWRGACNLVSRESLGQSGSGVLYYIVRPKGIRASSGEWAFLWLNEYGILLNSIKLDYIFSDIRTCGYPFRTEQPQCCCMYACGSGGLALGGVGRVKQGNQQIGLGQCSGQPTL